MTCYCENKKTSISSINLENEYYKLSKNNIDDSLQESIKTFGLLEPPLLLNDNDKYTIVFGHNRLKILSQLEIEYTDCLVTEKLDPQSFLKSSILKSYRDEIGPAGKAKLIQIIKKDFNLDTDTLLLTAKHINLPLEFIHNNELLKRFIDLPENLKNYMDLKDIGYKTIKNVLRLPDDAIDLLDEWTSAANIRTNIFKSIAELLLDIHKRDKTLHKLKDIDLSSIDDRRQKEDLIHQELFRLRYPEYSSLKKRADSIASQFKKNGINIDFPKYFEGDEIELHFGISKKDGIESLKDKLSKIDTQGLKELLDLL